MSAISLVLLLTAVAAAAVGAAALHSAPGCAGRSTDCAPSWPTRARSRARRPRHRAAGRAPPPPRRRSAASSSRRSPRNASANSPRRAPSGPPRRPATPADAPSLLGGLAGLGEDAARSTSRARRLRGPGGAGHRGGRGARRASSGPPEVDESRRGLRRAGRGPPPPPLAPRLRPGPAPAVAEHERTVGRLAQLADARTPLADVRQGPLGTLDVYLFPDGTTLCLSPGHRETAELLAGAARGGRPGADGRLRRLRAPTPSPSPTGRSTSTSWRTASSRRCSRARRTSRPPARAAASRDATRLVDSSLAPGAATSRRISARSCAATAS